MDVLRSEILYVIQRIRKEIRWRPGSLSRHLKKRKMRGHLPQQATANDYERIIQDVLYHPDAWVYLYWHQDTPYVVVMTVIRTQTWLVMFDMNGWMESAFVVENPRHYLSKSAFEPIGSLTEVLSS
ncbi:MAG: hypothetical protein GXP38_06440 [Chloroflexi bacterium]|nr:hypothetical protein [Chloroflexota bacterium]